MKKTPLSALNAAQSAKLALEAHQIVLLATQMGTSKKPGQLASVRMGIICCKQLHLLHARNATRSVQLVHLVPYIVIVAQYHLSENL